MQLVCPRFAIWLAKNAYTSSIFIAIKTELIATLWQVAARDEIKDQLWIVRCRGWCVIVFSDLRTSVKDLCTHV